MTDKQPVQADGEGGDAVHDDGVSSAKTHGRTDSESQGGAYPREGEEETDGFGPHGGQSEIAYHGPDNPNATTRDDAD